MFWFHVYLTGDYKGTYYAPDCIEAIKECMLRNKRESCSVVLVSWFVGTMFTSRGFLECSLVPNVGLQYKEE